MTLKGRTGILSSSRVATSSFVPTDIAGCIAWHDADDAASFTLSGSAVIQWNDKSGNARHLSQGTAGLRPGRTGTQNARTTVVFDGTDDFLGWTSFSMGTTTTVFMVLTPSSTAAYALGAQISGQDLAIISAYASRAYEVFGSASVPRFTISTGATGHNVIGVTRNGTSMDSFINGTSGGSGTSASGDWTANRIGSASGGGAPFNGAIAEVVAYDTVLGTTGRQSVENYLRTKWGTP